MPLADRNPYTFILRKLRLVITLNFHSPLPALFTFIPFHSFINKKYSLPAAVIEPHPQKADNVWRKILALPFPFPLPSSPIYSLPLPPHPPDSANERPLLLSKPNPSTFAFDSTHDLDSKPSASSRKDLVQTHPLSSLSLF